MNSDVSVPDRVGGGGKAWGHGDRRQGGRGGRGGYVLNVELPYARPYDRLPHCLEI